MYFLAAENFPLASIRMLRDAGHDVQSVVEDIPSVKDSTILTLAVREYRIVYFRFIAQNPEEPAHELLRVLSLETITLERQLERDRIRQRLLGQV